MGNYTSWTYSKYKITIEYLELNGLDKPLVTPNYFLGPLLTQTQAESWYLYYMVPRNMLRTYNEK